MFPIMEVNLNGTQKIIFDKEKKAYEGIADKGFLKIPYTDEIIVCC